MVQAIWICFFGLCVLDTTLPLPHIIEFQVNLPRESASATAHFHLWDTNTHAETTSLVCSKSNMSGLSNFMQKDTDIRCKDIVLVYLFSSVSLKIINKQINNKKVFVLLLI